jgi:hypothetical protein
MKSCYQVIRLSTCEKHASATYDNQYVNKLYTLFQIFFAQRNASLGVYHLAAERRLRGERQLDADQLRHNWATNIPDLNANANLALNGPILIVVINVELKHCVTRVINTTYGCNSTVLTKEYLYLRISCCCRTSLQNRQMMASTHHQPNLQALKCIVMNICKLSLLNAKNMCDLKNYKISRDISQKFLCDKKCIKTRSFSHVNFHGVGRKIKLEMDETLTLFYTLTMQVTRSNTLAFAFVNNNTYGEHSTITENKLRVPLICKGGPTYADRYFKEQLMAGITHHAMKIRQYLCHSIGRKHEINMERSCTYRGYLRSSAYKLPKDKIYLTHIIRRILNGVISNKKTGKRIKIIYSRCITTHNCYINNQNG